MNPDQLHGIEKNEYASELATTSLAIGYIQWLRDNGFGFPNEPILKQVGTIENKDAILGFDAEGNPFEPVWPEVDVIVGNPPFLGDRKMRRELGDEYVESLRKQFDGRLPSSTDFVTYWFERARDQIRLGKAERAALIATNSIRGGANQSVLKRINESSDIFFAWSDREWIIDGAAVRISIVGFGNVNEAPSLDGHEVSRINPDLTSQSDLTEAQRLSENSGLSFIGTQKSGPFDLDEGSAQRMIATGGNPNGLSNREVIKPWINAIDITRRPRNQWIVDFGCDLDEATASEFHAPFEYVRTHVKPIRDVVRREAHKRNWWRFGDARPGLRRAIRLLDRFIVTPMVSKHRVFAYVTTGTIAENLLVVIARSDDYFFGVLHSRLHELWSLRMGTALEDRPRYTPTTTFETFPFPWAPGSELTDDQRVQAIAEAARELVEKRDRWLNPEGATEQELKKRTLTNLYNERPTWLDLVHKKLDDAVFEVYGWPKDLEDEEILERLLALNLERAGIAAIKQKS